MEKFKPAISDEHLRVMGDIMVSYSILGKIVEFYTWKLLDQNLRTCEIITAELAFGKLRILAMNLYRERYGEDEDFVKLKDLFSDIQKFEEKRNQIVHSIWMAAEGDDIIQCLKTTSKKSGLAYQEEFFSVNDLANFAEVIQIRCHDVQDFFVRKLKKDTNVSPQD